MNVEIPIKEDIMPKVRRHNHIYDVLTAAIDALSQYPEHNELVEQLTYERELLKPPKWTETAIEEAVENFIRINGRVPTTEDLKHDRNLPTHPSIELRYGVTAAEWLDQRYPYRKATPEDKKNLYTEEFITEYYRIKPCGPKDFQQRRNKETSHSWAQVAAYHNLQSWKKLITLLGLPTYDKNGEEVKHLQFKVNVIADFD